MRLQPILIQLINLVRGPNPGMAGSADCEGGGDGNYELRFDFVPVAMVDGDVGWCGDGVVMVW